MKTKFLLLFSILAISLSSYAEKPKVPIDEFVDVGYNDQTIKLVMSTDVVMADNIVINVQSIDVNHELVLVQLNEPIGFIGSKNKKAEYAKNTERKLNLILERDIYTIKPPQYTLSKKNYYSNKFNSNSHKNLYWRSKYRNLPHKVNYA